MQPNGDPRPIAQGEKVTKHPVTGLLVEPSAEERAPLSSQSLEAQLERAATMLFAADTSPNARQKFFQLLRENITEERAFKIAEQLLHQIPPAPQSEEYRLMASDTQEVAAGIIKQHPGGLEHLIQLLDESREPTVRSAILRVYQGNRNEKLREIFLELLKDPSALVRLSAVGALLNQRMDTPTCREGFVLHSDLSIEEATSIARYVMTEMRSDVSDGCVMPLGMRDLRIDALRDLLIEHLDKPAMRQFLVASALEKNGKECVSGACSILVRKNDSEMKAVVAEAYRLGLGDVRTKLFTEINERKILEKIPNGELVTEAAKVFADRSAPSAERAFASRILTANQPEKHHGLFCEVFADRNVGVSVLEDLARQLKGKPDEAALSAAASVLLTPEPSIWERGVKAVTGLWAPKKFHLAEDSAEEKHQALALQILAAGDHPQKIPALRRALKSPCEKVRWDAAVQVGVLDPGATPGFKSVSAAQLEGELQKALGRFSKAALTHRLENAILHKDELTDRFLATLESPLVASALVNTALETRGERDLERVGDVFALRINAGHANELQALFELFGMTSSTKTPTRTDRPVNLNRIIDRVCLRALAQVDELLPDEVEALQKVLESARLETASRTAASEIVARLSKALEEDPD